MKIIFILAIITILVVLALRNSNRNQSIVDDATIDCANEVIQLLKKRPDANAEEIAVIYTKYGRSRGDIDDVTKLIKPKLVQAGIKKNRRALVMLEIRKAKELI